jgi:pSer/pThr/pTyr-binding forkhead associated (FHA) protein
MDNVLLVSVTLNGLVIDQHVFGKQPIIVGRDAECDIVLDNPGVSRKHVEITHQGDGFSVKDLGSSNGLLVNKQSVATALLADRDVLQIGKYVLFVRIVENPFLVTAKSSQVNPWQRDETVRPDR